MANSLLAYNVTLKPYDHVRFEACDKFMEGAYVPSQNKIILCSNIIFKREDFENALKRQLITMYDYQRAENYNFDNCKHLACTEVRAARFHSDCNPK